MSAPNSSTAAAKSGSNSSSGGSAAAAAAAHADEALADPSLADQLLSTKPSAALARIFSIRHLRVVIRSVAQQWLNLPHNARLFITTLVAFSLLLALFAIQLSLVTGIETELDAVQYHGRFAKRLVAVADAYILEQQATLAHVVRPNSWSADAMFASRQATDTAIASARNYYLSHLDNLAKPLTSDVFQPTFESELGRARLVAVRQQVLRQLSMIEARELTTRFDTLVQRLLVFAIHTTSELNLHGGPSADLALALVSRAAMHLHRSKLLADQMAAPGFNAALAPSAKLGVLVDYATEMKAVEYIVEWALKPVLEETVLSELEMRIAVALPDGILDELYREIVRESTVNIGGATGVAFPQFGSATNNTAALLSVLDVLRDFTEQNVQDETESADDFVKIRSAVIIAFCATVLALYSAQYVLNRVVHAERDRVELRNAGVMHDVLVRVGEYSDCFATCKLDVGVPPRVMLGTHCGVLEQRMQMCLASLKALVEVLPPLLFPEQLAARAKLQTELKGAVKDQWKLIAAADERRKRMRLDLLTAESCARESEELVAIRKLTANQVETVYGAFVTVDLGDLHVINTAERLNLAEEAYAKIVSLIESCVYQYGGVLYGVYADRAVACWGISQPTAKVEEQAATCAMALAARLNGVRRLNKTLRDNFPAHIGVTAGEVRKGIFGSNEAKIVLLLGPPLLSGIFVARSNKHHLGHVACDDTVQRNVSFVCKPIELINNNTQRVHEILSEAVVRSEVDIDTRLALYRKAFELFEKNYYREALRVFRAYTKQYGYDCSVERIQSIITGV